MAVRRTKGKPIILDKLLDLSFQELANSLEDELFVVDREYRIQFANSTALSKLGDCAEMPVGMLCYQVFEARETPCAAPLWQCPLQKVLKSGQQTSIVHNRLVRRADLALNDYIKVTFCPLKGNGENINVIAEMRQDVTMEKDMESQLFRRHHHLQALSRVSTATSGIKDLCDVLRICLDIALEVVNGEIGGILLFDEERRKLRYRVSRGLSPKYVEEMELAPGEGIAGSVLKKGTPVLVEDITQDPRVIHHDLISIEGLKGFASVPLKAKDKVVGVMNMASHMTGKFSEDDLYLLNSIGCQIGAAIEQARLYERLASVATRYQTLLRHALTAQEDERKRIARELHDETSQAITSLTLNLQAMIGLAEVRGIKDADFLDRLRTTHSYTVRVGNEIVKLMKELRPTLLDELGMPAAIQRYAKDTLQPRDVDVLSEFTGIDRRFPPEIEVTLFRVAQGLIGNILKHAEAKVASINLECDAVKCILQIRDDGKGFDVRKLTRVDPSGRGAGLFTIKERVKLVGGRCKVESRPGSGTKVTVKIPLPKDIGDEEDKGSDSR